MVLRSRGRPEQRPVRQPRRARCGSAWRWRTAV